MNFAVTTQSGVVRDVQSLSEGLVTTHDYGSSESNVVTTQRVFIDDGRGKEWTFNVDKTCPIRVGHEVEVWFLSTKRGGSAVVRIVNMTTGLDWRLNRIGWWHYPSWLWVKLLGAIMAVLVFVYVAMWRNFRGDVPSWSRPSAREMELFQVLELAVAAGAAILLASIAMKLLRERRMARRVWRAVSGAK